MHDIVSAINPDPVTQRSPVPSNPRPAIPPVAPVASIRLAASAEVVQVIEVPALFTRGSAAHVRVAPQGVRTNFPLTHCAKAELMQAFSPAVFLGG